MKFQASALYSATSPTTATLLFVHSPSQTKKKEAMMTMESPQRDARIISGYCLPSTASVGTLSSHRTPANESVVMSDDKIPPKLHDAIAIDSDSLPSEMTSVKAPFSLRTPANESVVMSDDKIPSKPHDAIAIDSCRLPLEMTSVKTPFSHRTLANKSVVINDDKIPSKPHDTIAIDSDSLPLATTSVKAPFSHRTLANKSVVMSNVNPPKLYDAITIDSDSLPSVTTSVKAPFPHCTPANESLPLEMTSIKALFSHRTPANESVVISDDKIPSKPHDAIAIDSHRLPLTMTSVKVMKELTAPMNGKLINTHQDLNLVFNNKEKYSILGNKSTNNNCPTLPSLLSKDCYIRLGSNYCSSTSCCLTASTRRHFWSRLVLSVVVLTALFSGTMAQINGALPETAAGTTAADQKKGNTFLRAGSRSHEMKDSKSNDIGSGPMNKMGPSMIRDLNIDEMSYFTQSGSNCVSHLILSQDQCTDYANQIGRTICVGNENGWCGYNHWGTNGNARPRGCFVVDHFYPDYVFYNPGGLEYSGQESNWVDTVCNKEAVVVCGSTRRCSSQPALVPVSSPSYGVRCCSDIYKEPNWRKKNSCDVWAKTKDSNGRCHMDVDYFTAESICNEQGARLCTQQELEDNCTQGTGCNLDAYQVWSKAVELPVQCPDEVIDDTKIEPPNVIHVTKGFNVLRGEPPTHQDHNHHIFHLNEKVGQNAGNGKYKKYNEISSNFSPKCNSGETTSGTNWATSSLSLSSQAKKSGHGFDQTVDLGIEGGSDDVTVSAASTIRNAIVFGSSKSSSSSFVQSKEGYTYSFDAYETWTMYTANVEYDNICEWDENFQKAYKKLSGTSSIISILKFFEKYGTHGLKKVTFGKQCSSYMYMEGGKSLTSYAQFERETTSSSSGLFWWSSSNKNTETESTGKSTKYGFEYKVTGKECIGEMKSSTCGGEGHDEDLPVVFEWTYKPIWEMNVPDVSQNVKNRVKVVFQNVTDAAFDCAIKNCNGNGACAPKTEAWDQIENYGQTQLQDFFHESKCFCTDEFIGENCETRSPIKFTTPGNFTDNWINEYREVVNDITGDEPICGVMSEYNLNRKDQRFKFDKCEVDEPGKSYQNKVLPLQETITSLPGEPFALNCDLDKVMTNLYSTYDHSKKDRRWTAYCTKFENTVVDNDSCKPVSNPYEFGSTFHDTKEGFTCPPGTVITGIYSEKQSDNEERHFKFRCCRLKDATGGGDVPGNGWTTLGRDGGPMNGIVTQISVGKNGSHVWAITRMNDDDTEVYYKESLVSSSNWNKLERELVQVSVSADGAHVWAVSCSDRTYHYKWDEGEWDRVGGSLTYVSVNSNGDHIWGVNDDGKVYYRNKFTGSRTEITGARLKQVSVSGDGHHVWGVNSSGAVYYRNGMNGNWKPIPGQSLAQVSVSDNGNSVWGVKTSGEIYYRDNGKEGDWELFDSFGLRQVSVTPDGEYLYGVDFNGEMKYRKIL